jgi:hypothetical protein
MLPLLRSNLIPCLGCLAAATNVANVSVIVVKRPQDREVQTVRGGLSSHALGRENKGGEVLQSRPVQVRPVK